MAWMRRSALSITVAHSGRSGNAASDPQNCSFFRDSQILGECLVNQHFRGPGRGPTNKSPRPVGARPLCPFWSFVHWSGPCAGYRSPCIKSNRSCLAFNEPLRRQSEPTGANALRNQSRDPELQGLVRKLSTTARPGNAHSPPAQGTGASAQERSWHQESPAPPGSQPFLPFAQ